MPRKKTADSKEWKHFLHYLAREEADASKIRGGDGVVAKFNGSCLIAGQGADNELNFNGKFLSILARVKANHITGYTLS